MRSIGTTVLGLAHLKALLEFREAVTDGGMSGAGKEDSSQGD